MSEAITEMIIPGTYIEVRAEGLIGVTGIATGNVGVVGTASKGPVGGPATILSSFADARQIFGNYDGWSGGSNNELTLVRALQQVFDNGGSTVYAVRCAANGGVPSTRALNDGSGAVVTLSSLTPGTWGHDIRVQVKPASANAFVAQRKQNVTGAPLQPFHAHIVASPQNVVRVIKGVTGQTIRLNLSTTDPASPGTVHVDQGTGAITFDPADQPVSGDQIVASYFVDQAVSRDIVLTYQSVKEVFTDVDAANIAQDINGRSTLVKAAIASGADARVPDTMPQALPLTGGANGENASSSDYATALAVLNDQTVNLVVLAGQKFSSGSATLSSHLDATEASGRDRIAICGADADDAATVVANAGGVGSGRFVLVAPGIVTQDITLGTSVSLPPAYTAAAVAGLIASLAVQESPTNKSLSASGLTKSYNDGELKLLIGNHVLALERKNGIRVVKGITTDSGAFRQISVRRIVDFAKQGTRDGSQPYIGRLNNPRVRGALKATLNGFLSDMVLNEALEDFTLDVTATRAQEIAGICVVTMALKPTFSIDYIKVIMNLS
jgi:Phage tail sheath protein subtilisin-like domain/Phage tail sheath C-terminal domain